VGATAGTIVPSKPAPIPCFTQTITGQDGANIVIVDCGIRKGAVIETPAPAGNTFRHGVWITHVGGKRDGTYSFRR
jgi:hypothetical protein